MKLVETSIKKPISVIVGILMLSLFGIIAIFKIPIQLTPTVDKPKITVDTRWEGASPYEIEREIIQEQEDVLKNVEGVAEMTSESYDGRGSIILEFRTGTDIDSALLKVSNQLNRVPEYPPNADKPVISSVDIRSNAMAWFILKPLPDNDIDINTLHDFADDFIKARFERVTGVGFSNVFGGQEREMQVVFDPLALSARNITLQMVANAIANENKNISAGDFDEGKRRYVVRTIGEYLKPSDVEDIVITKEDGNTVYLRDIAKVQLGYKKPDYTVRQKGDPAIAVNAIRETGANSIDTMAGLMEAKDELNRGILKQHNLWLENVYDETTYINSSIALVEKNILIGSVLAVIVLFFFLRSASSIFIIAIAIPISIVGTFLMMALLGRSINVVSLAGMSFAAGMVVDNSIVVLENIFRHQQLGKSRAKAAYDGTVEVWGAVLASTLTTVAVFLPVIFMKDQAGQLFMDIAIAISCAVLLSLIVSISVIPTLAARLLKVKSLADDEKTKGKDEGLLSMLFDYLNRFGHKLRDLTIGIVQKIISGTRQSIIVVVLFISVSIGLSLLMMPKTEYLPQGNRNLVIGILIPPPGYNTKEFERIGIEIENELSPYWGGKKPLAVGSEQSANGKKHGDEADKETDPLLRHFFYVARARQLFGGAVANDPLRVKEIIPLMQGIFKKIPGMISVVIQSSLFARGISEGRHIDIDISGPELPKLINIGRGIFSGVMKHLPGTQARPIPSLELGSPELHVIPDRDKMAELNLRNRDLGFIMNALVDGVRVSDYQLGNDEIDLILKGDDDFIRHTQDIKNLLINTPQGEVVTVGSIANIQMVNGPEQINHVERLRTITIQVTPPETMPLEAAIDIIREKILQPLIDEKLVSPPYQIRLSGTADDLTIARKALQWNFILALIITFLLMSSLFESFLYPFVVIVSVPLACLGGFLGLFLLNTFITYQALDILTMLGFVILTGTVVNNAILIVHQSLNHMKDGMDVQEAVLEAIRKRIRPIFMSTTTSVMGMLPLVLAPGSGSELYRGLGSVIVGGLTVSTVFTLVLIPALLTLTLKLKSYLFGSKQESRWSIGEL
ncbi:MAG: efflux RND transporter permease subunit [Candidatus Anammoxibacter sp.]